LDLERGPKDNGTIVKAEKLPSEVANTDFTGQGKADMLKAEIGGRRTEDGGQTTDTGTILKAEKLTC
jgi:hypothetical protein